MRLEDPQERDVENEKKRLICSRKIAHALNGGKSYFSSEHIVDIFN